MSDKEINQHLGMWRGYENPNCGSWVEWAPDWAGLVLNEGILRLLTGERALFSFLWSWQIEALMTSVVDCDCYCFFAAQNAFLPPLLIINSTPPPYSWREGVFFGAIFAGCIESLTEERNLKWMARERKERREGKMMASFVARNEDSGFPG